MSDLDVPLKLQFDASSSKAINACVEFLRTDKSSLGNGVLLSKDVPLVGDDGDSQFEENDWFLLRFNKSNISLSPLSIPMRNILTGPRAIQCAVCNLFEESNAHSPKISPITKQQTTMCLDEQKWCSEKKPKF